MGTCAVTGLDTNNKWRNIFICKEAVEMAKEMANDPQGAKLTQRERLQQLQKDWQADIEKQKVEKDKETT